MVFEQVIFKLQGAAGSAASVPVACTIPQGWCKVCCLRTSYLGVTGSVGELWSSELPTEQLISFTDSDYQGTHFDSMGQP